MLNRLSETITNAGIPLERVEGTVSSPILVFQQTATQQQQDDAAAIVASFDWSPATHLVWLDEKMRSVAANRLNTTDNETRVLRALILVLIDEINLLRQWITSFKTETAAANNLANFQARVASLPNMPDRTATQARTAITTAIEAGNVEN